MSNESQYLLLSRSTDWDRDLSAQEMQRIVNEMIAWFEQLRQQGKFKAAQPLYKEEKILSGNKGTELGPLCVATSPGTPSVLQVFREEIRGKALDPHVRSWSKTRAFLGRSSAQDGNFVHRTYIRQRSGSAKLHSHCGAANSQFLLLVRIACRSYR
jgi:hypothetical protein